MKFFVFVHSYNDTRSWWEPWHNSYGDSPEPVEAENTQALIDSLGHDGLYSIFTLADNGAHFEVQVSHETVTKRNVIVR